MTETKAKLTAEELAHLRDCGPESFSNSQYEILRHIAALESELAEAHVKLEVRETSWMNTMDALAETKAEEARLRDALRQIWLPDYVMKNDVQWAYKVLDQRRQMARDAIEDKLYPDEKLEEWRAGK